MSTPHERDLHTGPTGLRLRLREHGPTDGPPVLILHGFLDQSAAWDEVAADLPGRRVVAPDHRGHGLSAHVGEGGFYHFWDYVGDVDAVVDDLGGRVDLIGHSMGGTIAALFAATRPDAVRSLTLVEGLGPPDGDGRAVEQARTSLKHRRTPPRHKPVADLDDAVTRMRRINPELRPERARDLAARITRPDGDHLVWTWHALHRARAPQAFSAARFMQFLAGVEAPTLLVDGGRSPYQHIPDLAERRAALPHARCVVLDEAGHNPHHACPGRLAALLREHLDARP